MNPRFLAILLAVSATALLHAQSGRIYTGPDAADTGGIRGRFPSPLTHAIAIERDRTRVFLAGLSDGGKNFSFDHLPVGRYDLVLITRDGTLYEGLHLGAAPDALSAASSGHLRERIEKADAFFNRHIIHRIGVGEDHALVLVERLRDKQVLAQSGAEVDADIRRIEIIDLQQAADDWQMIGSRHLYREAETKVLHPDFFKHVPFPQIGNLRIIDTTKDLGTLAPPAP